MTSDEMVEAMADKIAYEAGHMGIQMPGRVARCLARAAIRACHDAGGLVLREVPGEISFPHDAAGATDTYARGHNAALAAFRAAAVEGV